jgi:putative transposase
MKDGRGLERKGAILPRANFFITKREFFLRAVIGRHYKKRVEPERIIEVVCKVMDMGRDEVVGRGGKAYVRGVLMKMLYEYGGLNQREIGELMGVDYSSVSVGRKRLEGEVKKDRVLDKKISEIERIICQE